MLLKLLRAPPAASCRHAVPLFLCSSRTRLVQARSGFAELHKAHTLPAIPAPQGWNGNRGGNAKNRSKRRGRPHPAHGIRLTLRPPLRPREYTDFCKAPRKRLEMSRTLFTRNNARRWLFPGRAMTVHARPWHGKACISFRPVTSNAGASAAGLRECPCSLPGADTYAHAPGIAR